jgi:hypothetical protein
MTILETFYNRYIQTPYSMRFNELSDKDKKLIENSMMYQKYLIDQAVKKFKFEVFNSKTYIAFINVVKQLNKLNK